VEEVEFEVAEFGDSGFEADGDFLSSLMACGRGNLDPEAGRLFEFVGIREKLADLVAGADFGLEEPEL